MARPTKEGLDYFPINIDIDRDDKLLVPIGKYGMEGFGIIVKLMGEIYRNSYYYAWTEKEQYLFKQRVNADINRINDIVNECLEWGFFHKEIFDKHHVLTSRGFQKRYIEASKRRKEIVFIDDYTLIDLQEACEKMLNPIYLIDVNGNQVNVYINPDNEVKERTVSTQSKVKEIKEKVKKKKYAEYVKMADSEHQKLVDQYGLTLTSEMISVLDNYKGSHGKKYASDYRAILSWVRQKVLDSHKSKQGNKNDIAFQLLKEAQERERIGDHPAIHSTSEHI